ncbi:MAG: MBL fold metallo-hydrolase [Gemmatimonadetes bacterium]|nr:MBL fold metallo-hydrolase [Gemmatimonadota bacterium]|tara:strand:- start:10052 stop:10780 length:729 start_codon:yes stop_codon:yes gene_type:complete
MAGKMELQFLGVGSFFTKTDYHNNLCINSNILIDCGFTAARSLRDQGRNFGDIDHLFITHTHADHIGGLEECAFFNRYVAGERKPKLNLPAPLADQLWEGSLRNGLQDEAAGAHGLEDYFDIVVVQDTFEIEGVSFRVVPTNHVTDKFCCGLVIDDRVYFSGDTRFDPDMVSEHGSSADVIYHEVQFFEGGIHTGLAELMTLPEELRNKISLMHYGDNWVDFQTEAEEAGFSWARRHVSYTH